MDDALRYALVIEVEDLFAQHEIFEHRGPARAGLQRVLIIGDADSLVGGQVTDAAVRARPRDALVRFRRRYRFRSQTPRRWQLSCSVDWASWPSGTPAAVAHDP
jgi:hypothetical protein